MTLWWLAGAEGGGGPAAITLTGDLTTAWAQHLAALNPAAPVNERERATLTTAYSVSGATDVTTVVSRFLKTRTAP